MSGSALDFTITAEEVFDLYQNREEEKLSEVRLWMEIAEIEWLETAGGLCVCIQETPTSIGLYIDAAGGLGFGGVVETFNKKHCGLPQEYQTEESCEVITVDFRTKRIVSRG